MALLGYIDILSRERIAGWVVDDEKPTTSVGVVVSIGGRAVARCLANVFRADLLQQGFSDGYSGFNLELAEPLSTLRAHAISLRREGDGTHLNGSPVILDAAKKLDAAVRDDLTNLLDSLEPKDVPDALAFFAEQTERLRDSLAERRSLSWDRRRRRGLGWQEPGLSSGRVVGPTARSPRALVIDDRVPAPGHDAGSDAMLSHMRALRRLGFDVTFVPSSLRGDGTALEAEGFATCLHPFYSSVEDVLRRQPDTFGLVYLHRLANAERYIGLARQHQPSARLLYSVADLHFLRTARQAQVERRPELQRLSERQCLSEISAACHCDSVLTHSTHEAELLRAHLPPTKVHVVPWDVPTRPTAVPLADRRGTAFIAHYAHQPNADAARVLIERLMPVLWQTDATFPCLLAGSDLPDWLRVLARPPAEVLGAVADLSTLFARVRLSVAPLAYGAGIKGKVLTSIAAGIPCVCTSVAAEGLDLPQTLRELVADDPSAFTALMLRLERDDAFNEHCAQAGLHYIAERFNTQVLDRLLKGALCDA